MDEPEPPVGVLVRAMAILNYVAATGESSLGEIAKAVGLSKPTSHRILGTLQGGDFIEQTARGRYRIGVAAFRIGSAVAHRLEVREAARPAMESLREDTEESVALFIRQDREALCVERLEGRYSARTAVKVGGTLDLHTGAGPRVLLASLDDGTLDEYLQAELVRLTQFTLTTADQIWADVKHTRDAGYAISRLDVREDMVSLGAPVRDLAGAVVAALSLSTLSVLVPKAHERQLASRVVAAADQASTALGYHAVA